MKNWLVVICLSLVVAALCMLAGCVVGPNYSRPQTPADTNDGYFNIGAHKEEVSDFNDLDTWWERFGDPTTAALVREDAALLEGLREEAGNIMLYTHRSEDNGKFRISPAYLRLAGNLCGKLVVGQAVAGENGQLLAPDERVHSVNNGDAGLYEISRIPSRYRIDRHSVDIQIDIASLRGASVDWMAQPVEYASEHFL